MIGTAAAILGSAVIGAGASALSASSASKANEQNAQLAQQTAANNTQLIHDTQAANTGIATGNQAANSDLITAARDYTNNIFQQSQGQNQGLIDANHTANNANAGNTALANQAVLNGDTQGITALNTGLRDQNGQLVKDNTAANEATIQGYGDKSAALFQPFVNNGTSASNAINALLGISGDASTQAAAFKNWANSTGYQYTLDSGAKAIDSSQAASGMLESGATLKALQDRGQQVGQQYFGNYLSALQGQASQGLGAAGSLSNVYQNTSNALTGNRNTGTNALVGINDTFGARQGNNINNYTTGTIGNSNNLLTSTTGNNNNYLTATTGNTNDYTSGLASNQTGAAASLGGLNTSTANSLINANSGAASGLMSNNNALASSLSGTNDAQAQNTGNLYGNIAGIASTAAGQYAGQQNFNALYGASGYSANPAGSVANINAYNAAQAPKLAQIGSYF